MCNCTYSGVECLICAQNEAYTRRLQNYASIISPSELNSPNNVDEETIDLTEPSIEEVRQQRLEYFLQPPSNSRLIKHKLTIHRIKLKEDLIRAFCENNVSV